MTSKAAIISVFFLCTLEPQPRNRVKADLMLRVFYGWILLSLEAAYFLPGGSGRKLMLFGAF